MKKLYFFSLLLFFTTEYAMKRKYYETQLDFYNTKYVNVVSNKTPINTAPAIIQMAPFDNNQLANNGLFSLLHKDVVTMICIALIKAKPIKNNFVNTEDHFRKKTTYHSISSLLSFLGMCTLNKWFYKIISEQKKYIYEKTNITPIVFAALIGDELNFALEKVLHKEQLYGQFFEGKYPDHSLSRIYQLSGNIKKLLLICGSCRRNKHAAKYKDIGIHCVRRADNQPCLAITKSKRVEQLIHFLVQKKENTLTEKQHTLLINTYGPLNNHTLLTHLYNDFIYTIQSENYLHYLFTRSTKIPVSFFTELKNRGGNLLSYDAEKITFLEKALINKIIYSNIINELFNDCDVRMASSPSYKLLFPDGISSFNHL